MRARSQNQFCTLWWGFKFMAIYLCILNIYRWCVLLLLTLHDKYNMKIHMSKLILETNITTILRAFSLKSPTSFHQLDAFTTRRNLDNLVYLYDMFWNNCLNKQETNSSIMPNVLELSTLNAIMQSTRDRKHPNYLQHWNHHISFFYLFHLLYK